MGGARRFRVSQIHFAFFVSRKLSRGVAYPQRVSAAREPRFRREKRVYRRMIAVRQARGTTFAAPTCASREESRGQNRGTRIFVCAMRCYYFGFPQDVVAPSRASPRPLYCPPSLRSRHRCPPSRNRSFRSNALRRPGRFGRGTRRRPCRIPQTRLFRTLRRRRLYFRRPVLAGLDFVSVVAAPPPNGTPPRLRTGHNQRRVGSSSLLSWWGPGYRPEARGGWGWFFRCYCCCRQSPRWMAFRSTPKPGQACPIGTYSCLHRWLQWNLFLACVPPPCQVSSPSASAAFAPRGVLRRRRDLPESVRG